MTFERARFASNKEDLLKLATSGAWNEEHFNRSVRDLDPRLIAIIRKSTEIDPNHRYPSMYTLSQDLRHFLHDQSVYAMPEKLPSRLWRFFTKHPLVLLNIILFCMILSLSLTMHSLKQALTFANRAAKHRQQTAILLDNIHDDSMTLEQELSSITTRLAEISAVVDAEWESGLFVQESLDNACESPHLVSKNLSGILHPTYSPSWIYWESALCIYPKNTTNLNLGGLNQPLQNAFFGPNQTKAAIKDGQTHDVVWTYIGFEDGTFMHYPGTSHFPEDFDPRIRPWYVHAGQDGVICTAPYEDLTLNRIVVPCTKKLVSSDNKVIGVVGLDIELETIAQWMNPNESDAENLIQNKYLLHESGDILINMQNQELPIEVLKQINHEKHHGLIETDGQTWVYRDVASQPWTVLYQYDSGIWDCDTCFD